MRLYNKTPGEIWADIPLSYRIVLIAGAAFITFSFLFLSVLAARSVSNAMNAGKGALVIRGGYSSSYLDPSMANDGKTSALTFTGLETRDGMQDGSISINLVTSEVPCATWRWRERLFTSRNEALLAPDGVSPLAQGQVRYETASLVYDPQDKLAPWKVFAYRYFWMGDTAFAQRYGIIVMRTADTLNGPWSAEQWIMSAAPDYPPPPYQNLIRTHINPMSPQLAAQTGYARPSVIEDRGVLLMSLVSFKGTNEIDRIVLMISLDHGKRWMYAGTMLTRAQIAQIGKFTRISGASLLKQGQAIYLAAVLGDNEVGAQGTYLFRITDAAKATVLTNDAGIPAPVRYIERQSVEPTALGGGYAAFDETCPSGIITSEHSGTRNSYQLFSTLVTPADQ